jgi:hypothetical protein
VILLVEGDGDRRALPLLLQRAGIGPVRAIDMKGKSNIVRLQRGFEDTVRRQASTGERLFVLLVDDDTTYAPYSSLADEHRGLAVRAADLAAQLGVIVKVYWATVELESWLIGGMARGVTYCALTRVPAIPANTETQPADPKQWLKGCLRGGYEPRVTECLAGAVDLGAAQGRNRSLREFLHEVTVLAALQ